MQVMGYAIVGGRAVCCHHPQRPRARLRDALAIDKQLTRDNACKGNNDDGDELSARNDSVSES